jgi:hypothetical protein
VSKAQQIIDAVPKSYLTDLPEDELKILDHILRGNPANLADRQHPRIRYRLDAVRLFDRGTHGLTYAQVGRIQFEDVANAATRIARVKTKHDRGCAAGCREILSNPGAFASSNGFLAADVWGTIQRVVDDQTALKTMGLCFFGALPDFDLDPDRIRWHLARPTWPDVLGEILRTSYRGLGTPAYPLQMSIKGRSAEVLVNGILIGLDVYGLPSDGDLLQLGRRVRRIAVNLARGAYHASGVDPDDWEDEKIMDHPSLETGP